MASNAPKRPQSSGSPDYTPNKSKSLPLSPQRQALLDDILALYSCHPTVERIKRYTPDAVYDDDFGYADNRYKIAGQWFSLPKLFSDSENIGYEVVTNDADLIQFKSSQKWTFRLIQKATTLKSLVSLSLEQSSQGADFICVKHHKDQTNDKEEDHKSLGFSFKKWQADNMPKVLNVEELQAFEGDKNAGKAKASI